MKSMMRKALLGLLVCFSVMVALPANPANADDGWRYHHEHHHHWHHHYWRHHQWYYE